LKVIARNSRGLPLILVRALLALAVVALSSWAALARAGWAAVAAMALLAGAIAGRQWGRRGWLVALIAALPVGLLLHWRPGLAEPALHTAPALGLALLCGYFGRTLVAGREPLITRYCRLDLGTVPDELRGYTRRLTAVWTVLFGALALECLLLQQFASPETWSLFVNVVNYGVMAALFIGEHIVRSLLFPHRGLALPWRTGRAVFLASLHHD
jgi:uncharacterized membrane protein